MGFFAALQFLTSIPVPWRREVSPEALGRSTAYFPVVGLIIGLILAVLNWLLSHILPPAVVNALLLVALVVITGALHLDGLADTCDGIAGHKPVEDRWRVMRDSHTGAFGVIGVVLVLLVKYVTLNSIPQVFMAADTDIYAGGQPLGHGLCHFRLPLCPPLRAGNSLQADNPMAPVYGRHDYHPRGGGSPIPVLFNNGLSFIVRRLAGNGNILRLSQA